MPRRTPVPPAAVVEREMGPLEREAIQRAIDRLQWQQDQWRDGVQVSLFAKMPREDTWEERWWGREAGDLLADLVPPIDPTAPSPVSAEQVAELRAAAEQMRPTREQRREHARRVAVRDEDEARWSRKVTKRVRAGMAPSEAFEEAHRRLAEWKERTGR